MVGSAPVPTSCCGPSLQPSELGFYVQFAGESGFSRRFLFRISYKERLWGRLCGPFGTEGVKHVHFGSQVTQNGSEQQ